MISMLFELLTVIEKSLLENVELLVFVVNLSSCRLGLIRFVCFCSFKGFD
jgi:hypothetical protein